MIIDKIRNFFVNQSKRFNEARNDSNRLESFRETEEMKNAEYIKREADRLAQLKQYQTAIEEYDKALDIYPYKGKEPDLFNNAAEFLFKCNYNIAACYSYMDNFDSSILYFDNALNISNTSDETKVRALMGKGRCYYSKKLLVDGHMPSKYILMNSLELEKVDKTIEGYKKEDQKKRFVNLSHDCFSQAVEFDKNNVEAWYNKGHMEVLIGNIKDAVQSFDHVLSINKNYENIESVPLFDEIKKEKGIQVKLSEIMNESQYGDTVFKTKTGHLVKTKSEMIVANFLFDNNILFQYNTIATWADNDDFRVAFYIPKFDLYIDFFPHDYVKEYQKSMRIKIREYEKKKKKHIYLTSEDEKNIEEALKLKMKPYAIL